MMLLYIILPTFTKLVNKHNTKKFMIICLIIVSIFLFDEFYNLVIAKVFDLPTATQFYKSLGFEYV